MYAGALFPATLEGSGSRATYALRLPHTRVLLGLRAVTGNAAGLIALPRDGKAPLPLVRLSRKGMTLVVEAPD